MFQEKAVMFMYCVTPVHAGAGTAIGTIDSPIQRERHTYHPTIAGSGIKGAMREHCEGLAVSQRDCAKILSAFGPKPEASSDHAGAVSFSDAHIVLFPVRSLANSFVYTTSPTALARLQRFLSLAGHQGADRWFIPQPPQLKYVALGNGLAGNLVLEAFEFSSHDSGQAKSPESIAADLSHHALPASIAAYKFFADKISKDSVILNDADFNHFVRHSTLVEPHVRISDESGTADDGGLFYVENLPPETLLVSLLMASPDRSSHKLFHQPSDVIGFVIDKLNARLVQIGGDATTGRGQILISIFAPTSSYKEER